MRKIYYKKYLNIFLISIIFIFSVSYKSLSQSNDFDREIYINKVKTCEIYKVPYKFGVASFKDYELIKKIFYISGYIYAEVVYTSGKVRKYNYNDDFVLENIVVEYKDEWNYSHKETHMIEYDNNKNPIKELVYSKGGKLEYKFEYLYDDRNNIIDSKTIENDGSVSEHQKFNYQYDSLGRIVKKEVLKRDDSGKWIIDKYIYYTYTINGKIEETKTYLSMGNKFKRVIYYYDDNDLLAIKTYYDLDGEPEYDEVYLYEYK